MSILKNRVVLVTGANGGLGREFVAQALARGARRVYASSRHTGGWGDERIVPLRLDVTDAASIAEAVRHTTDVTVVVNNAGVSAARGIIDTPLAEIRAVFETNFFGAVAIAQAYAPLIEDNGGGAIIDMHSVASWIATSGGYAASKAAFWSATNTIRLELAQRGIHVLGAHLSYADTPMIADLEVDKADPADVVRLIYDALEASEDEVLADDRTRAVKSKLSGPLDSMYPRLLPTDRTTI